MDCMNAQYMYHGTNHEAYLNIIKTGVITDIRYNTHKESVWLTTDINIAKRIALRKIKEPVILVIDVKK